MMSSTPTVPVAILVAAMAAADRPPASQPAPGVPLSAGPPGEGQIRCANLTYGKNKTSVCFSDRFLRQIAQDSTIRADGRFWNVRLETDELFNYPFAIMTGEGPFELTEPQRRNLKRYLERGGFLLASAGCSSPEWDRCFRRELEKLFPHRRLRKLEMSHPVFHTVYDIRELKLKNPRAAALEGLELDGRLVVIYSEQGLNDTPNAGKGCCCCGGNEILNAQAVNVNILAYALTH